MSHPRFVSAISIVALFAQAAIAEPRGALEATLGYDDNAYRLSENLPSTGSTYVDIDLSASIVTQLRDKYESAIGVELDLTKYDSTFAAADRQRLTLAASVEDRRRDKTHFGLKRSFYVEGAFVRRDYVDRATGLLAQVGTTTIDERFSNNQISVGSRFDFKPSKERRLIIDMQARQKNYTNDYQQLALERLDYLVFEAEPKMIFSITPNVDLSFSAPLAYRMYSDRRANALDGSVIAGTDVAYLFYGSEIELDWAASEALELSVTFDATFRRDNEAGFDNVTRLAADLDANYAFSDSSNLEAGLSFVDRSFDNSAVRPDLPTLDNDRAREQIRLDVKYERTVLDRKDINIRWDIALMAREIDNQDVRFSYDQRRLMLSFRIKRK